MRLTSSSHPFMPGALYESTFACINLSDTTTYWLHSLLKEIRAPMATHIWTTLT